MVSLVPSLTESVAVTRPEALVGATIWCTHPADLDVARVRGTKNPDLAAIAALEPDIVLANQEENRRVDVERLRAAGVPVWVTVIRTLDEAIASLRRMFTRRARLAGRRPGSPTPSSLADPAPGPRVRAAIPIWRDPWMVVGSATFTGDLAARLGLDNVYADHPDRYPHVDLADLAARGPTLDRPARRALPVQRPTTARRCSPRHRVALVEGRNLTWYGPSLVTARALLTAQLAAASPPTPRKPPPRKPPPGARRSQSPRSDSHPSHHPLLLTSHTV